MTDHQITLISAAISSGAPLIAVLIGIILNQAQWRSANDDIREIRRDIKDIVGKLGAMDVEIGKLMDRGK